MPEKSVYKADEILVVAVTPRITMNDLATLLERVLKQMESSLQIRRILVVAEDISEQSIAAGLVQSLEEHARGEGVTIRLVGPVI
jgi:hypothetical protein